MWSLPPEMNSSGARSSSAKLNVVDALLHRLDDYMGRAYEDAFRQHLRRLAREGALGPKIVATGPWWTRDGNNQIDAVVMAEHDKKRVPVLVGECKWGKRVDAPASRPHSSARPQTWPRRARTYATASAHATRSTTPTATRSRQQPPTSSDDPRIARRAGSQIRVRNGDDCNVLADLAPRHIANF
jgi:Archaea bacterial proteins of unknown function